MGRVLLRGDSRMRYTKLEFEVTQTQIDASKKLRAGSDSYRPSRMCPIALALQKQFDNPHITVGGSEVGMEWQPEGAGEFYHLAELDEKSVKFERDFDDNRAVQPIKGTITVDGSVAMSRLVGLPK